MPITMDNCRGGNGRSAEDYIAYCCCMIGAAAAAVGDRRQQQQQ